MLRRDGKFRRSTYPETVVGNAHGDSLREKWLAWIESESTKRLAFRVLSHDTDSSMALLVNPLISYAEVQLPLPDSAALWSAETAEQWKSAFSTKANLQLLDVSDLVDDPEFLNTSRDSVDTMTASLAVLSFGWSLAWEYTRFTALQRQRPRRWNALVTTARIEELLKLLGSLRRSIGSNTSIAPELMMRLENILLHLHMPFEDIQIFAGMEGPEQARAVYPMIRDWVKSEGARRAVYHAGQIIRAAKMLPTASIRGPRAIMLYHAGLAFWVYGLLFEKQHAADSISEIAASTTFAQDVWLDDVEDVALQRFMELGCGKPCIRWYPEDCSQEETMANVYLAHPDKVMEAVVGVVRENFKRVVMPHLTDKLAQLMTELKKSSRRTVKA